jgi:hypothetical protein
MRHIWKLKPNALTTACPPASRRHIAMCLNTCLKGIPTFIRLRAEALALSLLSMGSLTKAGISVFRYDGITVSLLSPIEACPPQADRSALY